MKVALILPYFGRFDKLFPLWLESCRNNSDMFDWLVFTDDRRTFDFPENVKVHYLEFEELRNRIQKLYDFQIELSTPYRLCNFKPAYGEIFEKYIEGYDAWGFCDNDMIYGCLSTAFQAIEVPIEQMDFLPQEDRMVKKTKIGTFGHLSFVENTEWSRKAYRYGNAYKIALGTNRSLFFDEGVFMQILKKHGWSEYGLHIADFVPRVWQHEVLEEPRREWMNTAHCFVWHDGMLWRYFVDRNEYVQKEEYAYIHFLKRPMMVDEGINLKKPLVIIPNRIINISLDEISVDWLRKVSRKGIFWSYWKNSLKPKNLAERIKNRLYQNKKDRMMIAEMERIVENYKE